MTTSNARSGSTRYFDWTIGFGWTALALIGTLGYVSWLAPHALPRAVDGLAFMAGAFMAVPAMFNLVPATAVWAAVTGGRTPTCARLHPVFRWLATALVGVLIAAALTVPFTMGIGSLFWAVEFGVPLLVALIVWGLVHLTRRAVRAIRTH